MIKYLRELRSFGIFVKMFLNMSKTFLGGFLNFTQSIFEISTALTILDIYEKKIIFDMINS